MKYSNETYCQYYDMRKEILKIIDISIVDILITIKFPFIGHLGRDKGRWFKVNDI